MCSCKYNCLIVWKKLAASINAVEQEVYLKDAAEKTF